MKTLTKKEQKLKNELLSNLEQLQELILDNMESFKANIINRNIIEKNEFYNEYYATTIEKNQKRINVSISSIAIDIYSDKTFLKIFKGNNYNYKKRDIKKYLDLLEYKVIEILSNDLDFISLKNLINEIIK